MTRLPSARDTHSVRPNATGSKKKKAAAPNSTCRRIHSHADSAIRLRGPVIGSRDSQKIKAPTIQHVPG